MGWLAAASIGGSILSGLGQSRANRQNAALARDQMAFQERMSNTAYQRAAKDLSKAGLNRILALGSPASSPGGQTAQMQNIVPEGAVGRAVQAQLQAAQTKTAKATATITEWDAKQKQMSTEPKWSLYQEGKKIIAPIFNKATSALDEKIESGDLESSAQEIANSIRESRSRSLRRRDLTRSEHPSAQEAQKLVKEHIDFIIKRSGKRPSNEYIQMLWEIFRGERDSKTGELLK